MGNALSEALALLDGPMPGEEWPAWRTRSLAFVARQRKRRNVDIVGEAVAKALAAGCSHVGAVPICSGCAEDVLRLLTAQVTDTTTPVGKGGDR